MSSSNPYDLDSGSLLDGIRDWIEIESPSDEPAAVNRMMDRAQDELEELGLAVDRFQLDGGVGDAVRGRTAPGDDRPGVLVLSHLDTVHPLGTLAGPLPFKVEGDRAYGPGIADMKGGAWMGINALRVLRRANEETGLPVTILLTPDEELGSTASRTLIEDEARRARYALVTEPGRGGGRCVTGRRGGGRYRMDVKGRAAHSGVAHQDGRSAVLELARQVIRLEAMTDYDRDVSINVGTIGGGTKNNIVPAQAWAGIDLRVSTAEEAERMNAEILGLRPMGKDVEVTVTGFLTRPPFTKDAGIDALYRRARSLAEEIDLDLRDMATGGGSDGNFTAALGIPTLDGIGADGAGFHTHDEHIFVSRLVPRQTLMIRLLQSLG
ncbi:MAG: M20 family metallopeptidase [Acetobacterales bacterium]